jgi:hypothetical protein
MRCNLCNKESTVTHIGKKWYCPDCSTKDFFIALKDIYYNDRDKKILVVSSKSNRLDDVSEFILTGLDLFNLTNSIILVHADGVENLTYPVDVAFIDYDLITQDITHLIKFKNEKRFTFFGGKDWKFVV